MPNLKQIEDILAQTQCGECGYDGCSPYAEAILNEDIAINRCRPGGELVIKKLAKLLNKPIIRPALPQEKISTANILTSCIGCTLCIQACPTDCITGAPRKLHTVNNYNCSGCKLCVKICPENCIDIIPNPEFSFVENLSQDEKDKWQENRRNEILDLVIKRNNKANKKLKTKKKNIKEASLSEEQLKLINKARKKSKDKYSTKNK